MKQEKQFYYECPDCGFTTDRQFDEDGNDLTNHECDYFGDRN